MLVESIVQHHYALVAVRLARTIVVCTPSRYMVACTTILVNVEGLCSVAALFLFIVHNVRKTNVFRTAITTLYKHKS